MMNILSQMQEEVVSKVVDAAWQKNQSEHLFAALTWAYDRAETALRERNPEEQQAIACRAGCDHCCVVNVSVTLPEAMIIVDYLHQQDSEMSERVFTRLDVLWREVRGLDDEERLALRKCCAFLGDDGFCQIYAVRPLFCRSVTSTDPTLCQTAVSCSLQGEVQPVLMYQFQKNLYEGLYHAIATGLERSGCDGRGFPLTGLVRYLLRSPDRALDLKGKPLKWRDLYA